MIDEMNRYIYILVKKYFKFKIYINFTCNFNKFFILNLHFTTNKQIYFIYMFTVVNISHE